LLLSHFINKLRSGSIKKFFSDVIKSGENPDLEPYGIPRLNSEYFSIILMDILLLRCVSLLIRSKKLMILKDVEIPDPINVMFDVMFFVSNFNAVY